MPINSYVEKYNEYLKKFFYEREQQYDFYKKADNLRNAMEKAFLSKDEQGNLNRHQYRVGTKRLEEALEKALENFDTKGIPVFKDFNSVYKFVESIRCKRFGLLTTYDVAVRIAKYLNLEVDKVYLHCGTTLGARACGLKTVRDGDTLSVDEFPAPLNQLSCDHLENFLCLYKHELANISAGVVKSCTTLKSNHSDITKKGCT